MTALLDGFNRQINYVRLSVTDRCDLRCVYCMAEDMQFLPRAEVLSLEEFAQLGRVFTQLGVKKLRLTGGEPLIRRGIVQLAEQLGQLEGLEELCLTTNATHLRQYAQSLKDAGVKRINISLDSLRSERFRRMTRVGDLARVLDGIEAARTAGFARIKLNCVALKHYNADEAADLVAFALDKQLDISFIEEMPLGRIDEHGRAAEFVSSDQLRAQIDQRFALTPLVGRAGPAPGPARYWQVGGSASRIGFISPHSHNFCGDCNRVRVTATGRLLLCLGQENSVDLRTTLRAPELEAHARTAALTAQIQEALRFKPERHNFDLAEEPQILRFMNMTGG